MSFEVLISAKELGKCYRVYAQPMDRLKQMLFARFGYNYGRDFWALRNVSFEVRRNEFVGVIGKNGAGKSTLLQMLVGTLQATEGTLTTRGRIVGLLELGSGMNPEFTGRENIGLLAAINGMPPEMIQARTEAIIEFSGISAHIDQPVKTYSSGMAMRLAFSVTAHLDPEVLIVDEALSVGDVRFQQKCLRHMAELKGRCTVILVSHDVSAVRTYCDRAIWIDGGRLRAEGTPDDICTAYIEDSFSVPRVAGSEASVAGRALDDPDVKTFSIPEIQADCQQAGSGAARITAAGFVDEAGVHLPFPPLGAKVRFCLRVVGSVTEGANLIVGVTLNNRLGETVLALNSLSAACRNLAVPNRVGGMHYVLTFQMPDLNFGTYTVSPAVATGTQDAHEVVHWVHDAIVLEVPKRSLPHLPGILHAAHVEVEAWPAH